jgi:S-adenosylmethionine/arginine decarboxylase-like enzyme
MGYRSLVPKNFISVDVYSCGKFTAGNIEEFVQNYFGCKEVEMNYIERGVKYNNIK